MPWRECHQMDERQRFVARRLDGEKMAVLCASRTGASLTSAEGLTLGRCRPRAAGSRSRNQSFNWREADICRCRPSSLMVALQPTESIPRSRLWSRSLSENGSCRNCRTL